MPRVRLTLTVVWEDSDLLEVEVRASNGHFAGATRVYTTDYELRALSAALLGFPRTNTDRYRFDARSADSRAALDFHCMNGAGHVAIRVELVGEGPPVGTLIQDSTVFEIVDGRLDMPAFTAGLAQMASTRAGSAELFPND